MLTGPFREASAAGWLLPPGRRSFHLDDVSLSLLRTLDLDPPGVLFGRHVRGQKHLAVHLADGSLRFIRDIWGYEDIGILLLELEERGRLQTGYGKERL